MGSIIVAKDEIFTLHSHFAKASNYEVSLGWNNITISPQNYW